MKNRCEYQLELKNNRTRKCKCYNFYKGLCWIHSQKVYEKTFNRAACVIQAYFRSKKIRNKVLNIYCNLPEELQTHIQSYMVKDHRFVHKFIPSYIKIIKTRWIKHSREIMRDYNDPDNKYIRYCIWVRWKDSKDSFNKKVKYLESIKTTFYSV